MYRGRKITLFFVFLQVFVLRAMLLPPHPISLFTDCTLVLLVLLFVLFGLSVIGDLFPLGSSTLLFGGK